MKRFYKDATVAAEGDGWRVLLDGRGIKTVGGAPQVLPTRALADAMASEWDSQGEEINPASFLLRDLADFAIDAIGADRPAVVDELAAFAETDTLCYRADPEDALYRRQLEVWEPLLQAAEERHGVRFERVSGVLHKPQPPETLARMKAELEGQDDFTLAALKMLVSLSASLVIGLYAIAPGADADALWQAASLEEEWQAQLWGRDAEAEAQRQARFEAFALAMQFAELARETE